MERGPRRLDMSGDANSVRDARHMVGDALSGATASARDAVVLMADEVLTNAVVHGGGSFLLHLDASTRLVRVEVTDATPGQPRVQRPDSEREHGRGVAIVDALATKWGTNHLGSQKVVWFELAIGR
ncbi:MAG: ATP-binding protein [Acidimicrobiales bacterium]